MGMREKLIELPIEDAVLILKEELKQRSDGYTTYLAHGGKGDPAEEVSLDALEMAVAALEQTRWIPVTERLPAHNCEPVHDVDGIHLIQLSDFVLGCTADGQMVVVQHEAGDERDWWRDYACTYYTITHWMPLPPAPWLAKGE